MRNRSQADIKKLEQNLTQMLKYVTLAWSQQQHLILSELAPVRITENLKTCPGSTHKSFHLVDFPSYSFINITNDTNL